MFRRIAAVASLAAASLAALPASASHVRRGPTATRTHHAVAGKTHGRASSKGTSSTRPRAIDDARATEIQGALVKAGYLQSVSGHWDGTSADAMRKMQADNGWQTKLIPDSRALIKLGLGANEGAATPASAALATPSE